MRATGGFTKVADGSAVEVFLAADGHAKRLLQVCRPNVAQDTEVLARFLDASIASTRLRHPSLLAAERCGYTKDGRMLVSSARVSGFTAQRWLRHRGTLSADDAVLWGVALSEALEHLHQHGVVHGNLTPEVVFLDGDADAPEVRLLDTRLMLFRGSRSLPVHPSRVLVRAEYLSPERAAGQRATPACDVYGLGVLLYELLVGTPPFLGPTATHTRRLHGAGITPGVPEQHRAFADVLGQCLAFRPQERFGSMLELRQALLSVETT